MLSRALSIVCFVAALTIAHRHCDAQAPRMIQVKPIQISGSVVNVRPGAVMIKTTTGGMCALRIPPRIEVRVTGKARRDVLKTGLHVRFNAKVDKRRSLIPEKVSKFTIITPSKEDGRMLGVFLISSPPAEGQPADEASRKKSPPPKAELSTFDIRARILAIKGNWLTLSAPNEFFKAKFRLEMADDPEIDVDVADYTLAKPGDTLTALAVQMNPQLFQAVKKIHIALAKPLGEGKRRTPPKRGGRKPSPDNTNGPSGKAGSKEKTDKADAPATEKPKTDGSEPAKKGEPAEKGDTPKDASADELARFLKQKPDESTGKPSLNLRLDGVNQELFAPCAAKTAKNLKAKFGNPKKIASLSGKLPIGKDNAQQDIQWQLWDYGTVRVLVDEVGDLRYFSIKKAKDDKE